MTFEDPAWRAQESQLLERVRRGDRAAFEQLYRAFAGPLLHRVLLPRLGDRDLAGDALGETFRTFVERCGDYVDQGKGKGLWSWLGTIAANKANDIFRGQARGGRALANYQSLVEPLWNQMGIPGPELAHDQSRLRDVVANVLQQLNPRYRRAIELRFLEDRARPECAEALAVTVATFDVLLLRALRSFRAAWQERFPAHEMTETTS